MKETKMSKFQLDHIPPHFFSNKWWGTKIVFGPAEIYDNATVYIEPAYYHKGYFAGARDFGKLIPFSLALSDLNC